MELVQKLVTELRAVWLELEACCLDVDSICVKWWQINNPVFSNFERAIIFSYPLAKYYEIVFDQEFSETKQY